MSEIPMAAVNEATSRPITARESFKARIETGWNGIKDLLSHQKGREALQRMAEEAKTAEVAEVRTVQEPPPLPEVKADLPQSHEAEPKEEFFLPSIEDFPKKLQPELKKGLERLKEDCKKLREEIALYSDQLPEQERKEKVIAMHLTIEKNICPFILGNSTTTAFYYPSLGNFYSREYIEEVQNMDRVLKPFCQGKAEFFSTIEVPSKWIETEPLRPTLNFDFILDAARNASQENQRFASNSELLTHTTGDTESTMKVLERGMLASKQYQLDNYGEYYFNTANYPNILNITGGVRVTDEGKFYTKLFSEKYDGERPRLRSGKHPYAEFFDIDFFQGGSLWGFEGEDRMVNFVFSRRQLISQSEFGKAAGEGFAIFDYVKGANVDLTREPFLMVVDEKKKEAISSFIREKMVNSPAWQGKIPNVDAWIAKHVFIKPESLAQGEELKRQLENKLFTDFQIPDKEGYFVPVDFKNEHLTYHSKGEKYPHQAELERPFSEMDGEELQGALNLETYDPDRPRQVPLQIMAELKADAYWSYQINKPSGLSENYSLQEHTLMVASQFEKYFADKTLPGGVNKSLLRLIIQGHDIGKGDAVMAQRALAQHEYTVPIVEGLLKHLNYDEKEVALAKGLLSGDPVGNYLKGMSNVEDSAVEVKRMAEIAQMDQGQFIDLLLILYQIDAGSYTEDAGGFRSLDALFVFDPQNRKMAFSFQTQPKIDELKKLVTSSR